MNTTVRIKQRAPSRSGKMLAKSHIFLVELGFCWVTWHYYTPLVHLRSVEISFLHLYSADIIALAPGSAHRDPTRLILFSIPLHMFPGILPMFSETALIARVEVAEPPEISLLREQPSVDEERTLRRYFGDEHYRRLHALAPRTAGRGRDDRPLGNSVDFRRPCSHVDRETAGRSPRQSGSSARWSAGCPVSSSARWSPIASTRRRASALVPCRWTTK